MILWIYSSLDGEDSDYEESISKGKRKVKGKVAASKQRKITCSTCYLDQTSVHPESYPQAGNLFQLLNKHLQIYQSCIDHYLLSFLL